MSNDELITQLSDRQEIHDALVSYCWGLDFGDWEAMRRVFTTDAYLSTTSDIAEGADAIVELMRNSRSRFLRTQHFLTNVRADIDGDTATVTSYVVGFDVHAGEPERLVRVVAAYLDDFRKDDGHWLIARRRIQRTWLDQY